MVSSSMKMTSSLNIWRDFLFLCLFIFLSAVAQSKQMQHYCPINATFNRNGTFQKNLDTILSNLSAYAINNTNGFANATAGRGTSDKAYGLFLCRGDVSINTCRDCVAIAAKRIVERCLGKRVSIIWYDECMLRYSNESIFSVVEESPWYTGSNPLPRKYGDVVGLLTELISSAAYSESGKKFATKKVDMDADELHTLAQCTPDLTSADCYKCLDNALTRLLVDSYGGRFFNPSCNIRFEFYNFYDETPSSEAEAPKARDKKKISSKAISAITASSVVALLLLIIGFYLQRRRITAKRIFGTEENVQEKSITAESFLIDLHTLRLATDNFSDNNKLGKGGFGMVFKGTLDNHQEVAVKKLSEYSCQGVEEFKNEILSMAKLQHKNLVRLIGYCSEAGEKLLIYEFVPNKSLDYFLFDPKRRVKLNWPTRHKIISDIAHGMLYLHQDSQFRIIHRDLKASNILLDSEMNAKISDFGMARIFGVDQEKANTKKIVGTYGYMAPEYAIRGQFSAKSDVYSFGILLLEIVSGRKNSHFYHSDHAETLSSIAWKYWKSGNHLELVDPSLDSFPRNEVTRCFHMGLLCVQEDPDRRPTIATIVPMLSEHCVNLPLPQEPPFLHQTRPELQNMDSLIGQ